MKFELKKVVGRARRGQLVFERGTVQTPAFMPVGTYGTVKGMTPEILYGNAEKPGLIHFITLFSNTNKININSAPPEVLKAIPLMSDESIQQIMNYRSADNTRKDSTDIRTILAGDYGKMAQYITTGDSNVYTIEALGYKEKDNDKKGYPLKAIIMIQGNDSYETLYYQSPTNIKKS